MSDWSGWVGRESHAEDRLDEALARRWLATFDRDAPSGGIMPQGIHWCLCTPDAANAALGEDGHPRRDDSADGFLPPIPLPRRMWAASEVEFLAPLSIGAAIERSSRILSVDEKQGSTGSLALVVVEHVTRADNAIAVREKQTLVYREAVAADAPVSPPPLGEGSFDPLEWQAQRGVQPRPPLLFRYSALTFNTHRIHYDLPYAREVERYRGLVVHGPLMAGLLLQLSAEWLGENALSRFAFRALSPAIAGEPLHLVLRENGGQIELGAFAADGRQVVRADAARG